MVMAPTFVKITPSLPVTNVPDAIKFWTEKLGFRVAGRDRDDHTWLQLASHERQDKSDAPVNVYLRRRGFPDMGDDDVKFGKIYIRLDEGDGELESLLESLRAKNVTITSEISEKPWGLKDFTIMDPDTNLINFSQAVRR